MIMGKFEILNWWKSGSILPLFEFKAMLNLLRGRFFKKLFFDKQRYFESYLSGYHSGTSNPNFGIQHSNGIESEDFVIGWIWFDPSSFSLFKHHNGYYRCKSDNIQPCLRYLLVVEDPDRFGWLVTLLFFFNYESLFALVFILVLVGWGWLLELPFLPRTKF